LLSNELQNIEQKKSREE